MFWIGLALMIAGFVGIVICKKKQKTNPAAQGLAVVCLIFILIGAGIFLYNNFGDGEQRSLIANEARFASSRYAKVAAEVKKAFAGKNAVIIVNAGYDKEEIAKTSYDALIEGLAGVNILATEVLAVDVNNPEPIEMQIDAKKYNSIFSKYANADIFVICSQMPQDIREVQKFTVLKGGKAKVALLASEAGEFGAYIQKGKVVAATLSKHDDKAIDPDTKAPSDLDKAFDIRYVLVTPANLKEVYGKYKSLFVNR
ncbi:MAG: hypothetical protein J6S53_01310 [Lentisphaeria bacterium]|nr:hypothetical protein [Lentisphaeria bacterium]